MNILLDAIDIGPAKGRPRLNVIVEFEEDYKRLKNGPLEIDSNVTISILREFSDIAGQIKFQKDFDPRKVLLIVSNFSEEVMIYAAQQFIRRDVEALIQKFSSDRMWKIASQSKEIVAFFLDEIAKNSAVINGAGERIRQACYDLIKRYDAFNYITPQNLSVLFDSKENLDKNFQGNLFYYFR
ncbi:MAG: hypothetical protein WCI73_00665 [Phycisphaerae bacterium]